MPPPWWVKAPMAPGWYPRRALAAAEVMVTSCRWKCGNSTLTMVQASVYSDHGLIASAQNPSSVSTTCASMKPAAASLSGNPLFGCLE